MSCVRCWTWTHSTELEKKWGKSGSIARSQKYMLNWHPKDFNSIHVLFHLWPPPSTWIPPKWPFGSRPLLGWIFSGHYINGKKMFAWDKTTPHLNNHPSQNDHSGSGLGHGWSFEGHVCAGHVKINVDTWWFIPKTPATTICIWTSRSNKMLYDEQEDISKYKQKEGGKSKAHVINFILRVPTKKCKKGMLSMHGRGVNFKPILFREVFRTILAEPGFKPITAKHRSRDAIIRRWIGDLQMEWQLRQATAVRKHLWSVFHLSGRKKWWRFKDVHRIWRCIENIGEITNIEAGFFSRQWRRVRLL